MKIHSVRTAALPALLFPLIAVAQTSASDEQTMVVTAAPTATWNVGANRLDVKVNSTGTSGANPQRRHSTEDSHSAGLTGV